MTLARNRNSERGAAMVEFAIVLPLLLTLIFGMIEFGVLLYDKAMITNASREGARAGIVFGRNAVDASNNPVLPANLVESVVNGFCANNLITFGSSSALTVTTESSTLPGGAQTASSYKGVNSGEYLWVTVVYPYEFLLLPNFITALTGTINLTSVTQMRAE